MVRIKHRYLLVNILYPDNQDSIKPGAARPGKDVPYTVQFRRPSPDSLNSKILTRLIRDEVSHLFGDYGSGMTSGSLQIKYFSPATSTAIVRVAREHYRLVWTALTLTTRIPRPVDQACVMQVVRVSGTIKKAEEAAILRAKATIKQAQRAAAGQNAGKSTVSESLGEYYDDGAGSTVSSGSKARSDIMKGGTFGLTDDDGMEARLNMIEDEDDSDDLDEET